MTPGPEARASAVPTEGSLGRSITRNTIFIFAGRVAYVLGWTLIAPFMVAKLGPERFGLWSLLTVFSGLYLTFDLGLSSALTKFVAEFRATGDHASLRRIYTFGAVLYAAIGLVFVAAAVAFRGALLDYFHVAPGLRAEAGWAIVAAAAGYLVLNAYMLLASVLSGLQRLDLWTRISTGVTLAQLAGVAVVLAAGGGIVALMLNTAASLVLGVVLCRRTLRQLAPEIGFDRSGIDPSLFRRLLRYSAALQIINLGVLVQFQLDKVLFGRFLGLTTVGDYELGYRVASSLWAAPALLLPALLPAIAHLEASGDRDRVLRLYRRASRYVLAVALPLAGAILVLAPALFTAWLGPGHRPAALAAMALAAMMGVNILTGVGSNVARGIGRPRLEAEYHVLAMALHVTLSLLWIPRYGYVGGLAALAVSSAVGSLYFVWRFHRFMGESLRRYAGEALARPLAAALLGGVAAWAVAGGAPMAETTRAVALARLLAGGAAFLAVSAGTLLVTRHLSLGELRSLAAGLGRRPRVPVAGPAGD